MPTKFLACEVGPNYTYKDGLKALISLFNIFEIGQKKDLHWSENWFKNYLNTDKFYFTDSGRTGLYILLKSLNLPVGSEILIQGFSCVVLPNSIWQSGLKPVLCDISPAKVVDKNQNDNNPNPLEDKNKFKLDFKNAFNLDPDELEQKINSKTKVLIVQYTFGLVPDMQKIVEICQKHNLILIEDVAHSLGAECEINRKNYKVGCMGHVAFFSFGRDKIISTTIGGSVSFNKSNILEHSGIVDLETWQKEFEKEYQKLKPMPIYRWLQSLSYAILTSFIIKPFYHFGVGKAVLFLSIKIKLIGDIYTKKETTGTAELETNSLYSQKLASLLRNQLEKMQTVNQHRQKIAKFYAEELGLPFDPQSVYMRFPFVVENQEVYDKIKSDLRKEGILVGTWYTSLFMQNQLNPVEKFDYKKGDLPIAEELVQKRTLNLPTNIGVTLEDAAKIVKIVLSQV